MFPFGLYEELVLPHRSAILRLNAFFGSLLLFMTTENRVSSFLKQYNSG